MNTVQIKRPTGSGTFDRGIHLPHKKRTTEELAIEAMDTPQQVLIPLHQHAGAPAKLTVKPRQELEVGDVIAEATAAISAPVHTSVRGTVGRPAKCTLPNGRRVEALTIKADPDQSGPTSLCRDYLGENWDPSLVHGQNSADILATIRESGIVGMGGATFPTWVKLNSQVEKPVRRLLVNGCECEPYLTADSRLMEEAPSAVVLGALLAGKAAGVFEIIVAIEDNKPNAIAAMKKAAKQTWVQVRTVKTKYPMGGERQLIPAVWGEAVPTGGLPLDVGVAVVNVSTAAAITQAVMDKRPLTHRVVTVTGPGVVRPSNVFAPVGASFRDVIDFCGGLKPGVRRVVAGGPMMGFAVSSLDVPITKGTSGILALFGDEIIANREQTCIRCGKCVDACPLGLIPSRLGLAVRMGQWGLAEKHHIAACMECGCCAVSCPSAIPLVQLVRAGKVEVRKRASGKDGR